MKIENNPSITIEELKLINWNEKRTTFPCFVDAKIDGEYNLFLPKSHSFVNKNGLCRTDFSAQIWADSLSLLVEEEEKTNINLICELHWQDGHAGDLYEYLSHKGNSAIRCTVLDYFNLTDSGKIVALNPLIDRRATLVSCYKKVYDQINLKEPPLSIVPTVYCNAKIEAEEAYEKFVNEGYEGVVYRPADVCFVQTSGMKRKHKETSDLKILSIDPFRNRIGVENPFNLRTELCGVKTSDKKDLNVGDIVEIEYLQKLYNKQGALTGLRNPVFIRKRDDKKEVSI